jgi:dTDP-4-amino-4,6-dideoxygalactose transaminase
MIAHTLGNPFNLGEIKAFCDKHNLWLVEDNCDSLGSEYTIDGETRYIDNTAYFISDTFKCKNGVIETEENDYVANNTIIFPNLRLEYMFGSATMQSVDANIYIDRGINAALDKHLKLGEVTSMEALENYTNGYFKMMNN